MIDDRNINNALFVTTLNHKLNENKVPTELIFMINEYVMTNKIGFTPTTSHNPYRVQDGLGVLEFYSGPVDVATPGYIDYVNGIRDSINILAVTIKQLNSYITSCSFNEWTSSTEVAPYRHNFHKLIAAIRHDLVYDYNQLIRTRVFYKNLYKIVREHTLAHQVTPTTD